MCVYIYIYIYIYIYYMYYILYYIILNGMIFFFTLMLLRQEIN